MTPSAVVRDFLGIYLNSDVSMRYQVSRTVSCCFHTLLPSLVVSLGLPVSCCIGANEARFRECYTSRRPVVPAKPSSGGHERIGSSGVPVQSMRSHHSAALSSALVMRAGANCLQASCASVPKPPCTRTVHRPPLHWSYHRLGFEPLAIELFPSQQHKRGTVCRRK